MKISSEVKFLDLNHINNVTANEKFKAWGDGEWVLEDNLWIKTREGLHLIVKRVAVPDGLLGEYLFGGHLCGYVSIPIQHKWCGLSLEKAMELDIEVHGGITFADELPLIGQYCLGFDCAHMTDVTPSMENFYSNKRDALELKKRFSAKVRSDFFDKTYRNMEYAMTECRALAAQILKSGAAIENT